MPLVAQFRKIFPSLVTLVLLLVSAGNSAQAQPKLRLAVRPARSGAVKVSLRCSAPSRSASTSLITLERAPQAGAFSTLAVLRTRRCTRSLSDSPGAGFYYYKATLKRRAGQVLAQRMAAVYVDQVAEPESPPQEEVPSDRTGDQADAVPLLPGQSECPADFAAQLLSEMNSARAAAGSGVLAFDARLNLAARSHAIWMASVGRLSHDGWLQTTLKFGFPGPHYSQNIWTYMRDARVIVEGLLSSPGHRNNLLNPVDSHVGIGCVQDAAGKYWGAVNHGS